MKKLFMVLAATVVCGACLFTSCTKEKDLNVPEKIIGKWVTMEADGHVALTNDKNVTTFISSTKAIVSVSRGNNEGAWYNEQEFDVAISGNKVTLTGHPDEHQTVVYAYDVTAINGSEFSANLKMTVTVDDNVVASREGTIRLTKLTADYSEAILGLWECQELTGIETYNDANARLEFFADGTYNFYRRSDAGFWTLVPREHNEYFVDGTLLCTRWQAEGEEMDYEWWEIASATDDQMQWTALRKNADGTTFQQSVTWQSTTLK